MVARLFLFTIMIKDILKQANLLLPVFAMLAALGIAACGVDDEDSVVTPHQPGTSSGTISAQTSKENLITKISITSNGSTDNAYEFQYDENGGLKSCHELSSRRSSLTLEQVRTDSIIFTEVLGISFTKLPFKIGIKLNSMGLCEKDLGTGLIYNYDNNGYLIETFIMSGNRKTQRTTYNYNNGDLSSTHSYNVAGDSYVSSNTDYGSSLELNDAVIDLNIFFEDSRAPAYSFLPLFGRSGKKSSHILSYMRQESNNGKWEEVSNVDVTRDSKGRIIDIKFDNKGGNSSKTTYETRRIIAITYAE